ncbi:hypothetical protein NAP1_00300 [Erythrobacter sp. NAP1]|uniref:hypothetical protein n=1 Tax=Erythrobacter sp. NAP1 TaxID=237727 RepID=UPI0000686F8B|nr:hypothetical protein [Erythrobacter sp. NAP1]EAQ29166.1 hypothetical protein NAP1_00300 [Erythrobacter sp. NAP1]
MIDLSIVAIPPGLAWRTTLALLHRMRAILDFVAELAESNVETPRACDEASKLVRDVYTSAFACCTQK